MPRKLKLAITINRSIGFLSGLFYFTFAALMLTNWFLWRYIKLRKLSHVDTMKNIKISLVFALSYIYRAVYDTFLAYTKNIDNLARDQPLLW